MNTVGILIPCDGGEPEPLSVGDYLHIGELGGGHFDCVRKDIDPEDFDTIEDANGFVLVGYVHDEGLLIGLPYNGMASLMFGRDLVGPCVVVSGSAPNGYYDGDNHDLPEWFNDCVFDGTLQEMNEAIHGMSELAGKAMALAFQEGVFDERMMQAISSAMDHTSDKGDELVGKAIAIAIAYCKLRAEGMPSARDMETALAEEISDDEIEKFFNEQEGK